MKIQKYILGIILFCAFANQVFAEEQNLNITDSTTEQDINESVYGDSNPQGLYLRIYESVKNDLGKKSLERISKQSTFSQSDIEQALEGNFTENLIEKCKALYNQSNLSSDLYSCLSTLEENYNYEKRLVALETEMKGEGEANEIWSDGELSNSFFDLIVDLNIIEIILFGENTYEFPFSDNYDFSDNSNNSDSNNAENQNSSNNSGSGTNLDGNNQNTDGENSGDNQNNDNNNINTLICQDPDAITLVKNVWQADENLDTVSDSNSGSTADSQESNNSNQDKTVNPYLGGGYHFPQNGDSCDGTSLFQGLLCVDKWPCENFFCIKVSFVPQDVGNGGNKATSVKELVTIGLEQLNFLKGHTLTVHKNSNERFMTSVGKFFDRPIRLDVITQGIPVKFSPEETSFDDEDKSGELNLFGKFIKKIGEEIGSYPTENYNLLNNEDSRSINLQSEEGDLQNKTYQNLMLNTEQQQKNLQKAKQNWKKAEKVKHSQSFWEDFRTYLNITVLYFSSIQEAFLKLDTSGTDILDETGQSCN